MWAFFAGLVADPKALVPVIAAFVAALASFGAAWLSFRFSRAKSRDDSRTAYEFEARKRLYAECQPILFQMADAASSLWGRLSQMATRASEGRLDPGQGSWMSPKYDPYYAQNTIYRIFRLLALGRLLKSKLTLFDASLDDNIKDKFILGSIAEDVFCADFALAEVAPVVSYDPYGSKTGSSAEPGKYAYQGLVRGELESLIDSLIKDERTNRVMRWHEFEEALANKKSPIAKHAAPVRKLFVMFHPDAKPVLWRILVTYAVLCKMLIRSPAKPVDCAAFSAEIAELETQLDYRRNDKRAGPNPAKDHLVAATSYLSKRITEERAVYTLGSPVPR